MKTVTLCKYSKPLIYDEPNPSEIKVEIQAEIDDEFMADYSAIIDKFNKLEVKVKISYK